jgi:NADH-quinone oxidoreductase subunit G
MGEAAKRLAAVRQAHGPEAIGFIGSNRATNEANYLLGRLARAQVGTNNLDHHRTADYAGLAAALGPGPDGGVREHSLTMGQLGEARAILLIGNDTGNQNPLVDWRIREAVRHFGARIYLIHSQEIKLRRRAKNFVRVPEGTEGTAVRWLAGAGPAPAGTEEALGTLKKSLEAESDVAILFGAGVAGQAVANLVAFGAKLPGRTRYMPLGDYVNSRGAAEMGLLPDRLPGYAWVDDTAARGRFEKLWSARLPESPGMDAQHMLDAAASGKLRAMHVVGANPLRTFGVTARPAGIELLIVQELFLTETAQRADIVLPATCAYENNGTVTNTAGEVQLLRKAADPPGLRSDFDLLRILSHQLERQGVGRAIHVRSEEAAFEEIRKNVPGYDISMANLMAGTAELAAVFAAKNGHRAFDVSTQAIFSARDSLFTSGTLGRFCTMIGSLSEARSRA